MKIEDREKNLKSSQKKKKKDIYRKLTVQVIGDFLETLRLEDSGNSSLKCWRQKKFRTIFQNLELYTNKNILQK